MTKVFGAFWRIFTKGEEPVDLMDSTGGNNLNYIPNCEWWYTRIIQIEWRRWRWIHSTKMNRWETLVTARDWESACDTGKKLCLSVWPCKPRVKLEEGREKPCHERREEKRGRVRKHKCKQRNAKERKGHFGQPKRATGPHCSPTLKFFNTKCRTSSSWAICVRDCSHEYLRNLRQQEKNSTRLHVISCSIAITAAYCYIPLLLWPSIVFCFENINPFIVN